MKRLVLALCSLAVLFAWQGPGQVGLAQRSPVVPLDLVQRAQAEGSVRVIVELSLPTQPDSALAGAAQVVQRQAIAAAQGQVLGALPGVGRSRQFETIPFLAIEASPASLTALAQMPGVRSVTEDRLESISLAESAPIVQAPQAWAAGYDGSGWMVAVLDTGVSKTHPFFGGRVVEEACYSANGNCPNGQTTQVGAGAGVNCTYFSGCFHGTHVTGIVAGSNATFSGVAKNASIMAVQVFTQFTGANCNGTGEDPCGFTLTSDQIMGLERVYLLRNTYQIAAVNMSLGGGKYTSQAACDAAEPARKAAIDNLRAAGIATVVATGNNGFTDGMSAPACISSAVSVGSVSKFDTVSSFSNSASFVSLLAPGEGINSSGLNGTYQLSDGTSMATPHVAGAWAIGKQKTPGASVSTLLAAFQTSNAMVTDFRNGVTKPRLQIATALGIGGGGGADAYEPDGTPALASTIVSGVPQTHTFHVNGDYDYATFPVTLGTQYTITTSNLGAGVDTVLYLLGPDGTTIIDSNDDVVPGVDQSSRIVHTAQQTTTLYVVAIQFTPPQSATGPYTLTMTSSGGGGAPEIRLQPTSLNFTPATNNTIFVELDWMETAGHNHKPSQQVLDAITATFAREGFTIAIEVSNAVPHQDVLAISGAGPSASPAIQAIKAAHFNHAGDPRYFYSLWAHSYSYEGQAPGSSGIADLPGNTNLVTLGTFSGSVGTTSNQIGTFMHEFGHNLGQKHGGSDHDNFKPNYLSIMNYHYQLDGLGPSLVAKQYANATTGLNNFGYSHGLLPSLNEASLVEANGIGLGRGIDWNCNGSIGGTVARDIQADNHCNANGLQTTLADFDNWATVNSFVQAGAVAPTPTGESSVQCITAEENAVTRGIIDALRAQGVLPSEDAMLARPAAGVGNQGAGGKYFEVFNDGTGTLNVTGITLNTPAAWLTFEPTTFTVPAGGSQRVQVYVNFATRPAGDTSRQLIVASNDADENPYPNAVFVTVAESGPGAFQKLAPASGATGQLSNLTLSWGASSGATGYAYCIDTSNDNACSNWTSTGTNTSVAPPSLANGTTYYWHVRASNASGTTYANASTTAFWSFTTIPTSNIVQNGGFANGLTGWSTFALPDSNSMQVNTTGGVLQFNRTGTQSLVFQSLGQALPAQVAVTATFKLGNTDGVRKRISVLIQDADFSDLSVCTWWLPANLPLTTFTIQTHTTKAWTNATVAFYAASVGNGFYQVDDVTFAYQPAGASTATTCVDPLKPTPPSGSTSGDLITNGAFTSGLTGWTLFGQINGAVNSGVFEFIRLAGNPAGVILQSTSQPMATNQIVTATFQLGNSSGVRKRVTVLLHDAAFGDLSACTFWLAPGQALGTYTYRTYATQPWTNATFSVYGATVGAEQWMRLDNVSLQRTPGAQLTGTHCIEPGGAVPDELSPVAAAAPVSDGHVGESAVNAAGNGAGIADGFAASASEMGSWTATASDAGRRVLELEHPIDLTTATRASLTVRSWLSAADSRAEVQVSSDGVIWETLHRVTASDTWMALDVDLSPYLGEIVRVRFVLDTPTTDGTLHGSDAWRLEDVDVDQD